jgi:hypothetical protein
MPQIKRRAISSERLPVSWEPRIWGWLWAQPQRGNHRNWLPEERLIKMRRSAPERKRKCLHHLAQATWNRYDADKRHIREIKPDNARGEKTGQKQLDRYKAEMDQTPRKPHTTELTKYPPKPPQQPQ